MSNKNAGERLRGITCGRPSPWLISDCTSALPSLPAPVGGWVAQTRWLTRRRRPAVGRYS